MNIRTYSELMILPTFEERFEYLQLGGKIGEETFGFDRYINQKFYTSKEWRKIREDIITRDMGCDLACLDREIIDDLILIHHMNPINISDIVNKTAFLLNPEYLICTTKNTHNAIHYGSKELLYKSEPVKRFKNDTCPWRH